MPIDFEKLNLGAEANGADSLQGILDDFAVYGVALSPPLIGQLAAGFNPEVVGGGDAPIPLEISIRLGGNNIIVEWSGGVLQSADNVAGPYQDVTDIASPLTLTLDLQVQIQFLRVRVE